MKVLFWSLVTVLNVFFMFVGTLGEYSWINFVGAICGLILVIDSLRNEVNSGN